MCCPAIQREFVWKPEQIAKLFDSLMQGYPFGTFLFLSNNLARSRMTGLRPIPASPSCLRA